MLLKLCDKGYIYKICGTFGTQTIAYPDPEEQTINMPEELVS